MGREHRADRGSIKLHHVSLRFTHAGIAALDAAVARTAAVAETRGISVTRTDFISEAVFRAIRDAGIVISDPAEPLLLLKGEVESTQPSLPGVEARLFRPSRRR